MSASQKQPYGLQRFGELVEREVGLDLVRPSLPIQDRDAIGERATFGLVVRAEGAAKHGQHLREVVGPELRQPRVDERQDRSVVDEQQRRSGEEPLGEGSPLDDAGAV